MTWIPNELENLYERYFGKKPVVLTPKQSIDAGIQPTLNSIKQDVTTSRILGSTLSTKYLGVDIWLPVTLLGLSADIGNKGTIFLPYVTVNISGSSDWIKTPLNLRRGTAKELFSMNDYEIGIKGFFIDKQYRSFPEEDLFNLKKIHEGGKAFRIDNAITNIYLGNPNNDDSDHVVLGKFNLTDIEGGKKSMRPFSMELISDSVFVLEVDNTKVS